MALFLGRDFPPFEDQGARLLGVDLGKLLAVDETITAVTSRLRTLQGTDALPQNHLPVAPQFSGSQVHQLVVFDNPPAYYDPLSLVGNIYALSLSATTSAGRNLMPWARFSIKQGLGVTGYAGGATPATAQSVMLTCQPLFYTLPILQGGYIGQDFTAANQTERLTYGLDFAAGLSPNETITSAVAFLGIEDGTDAAVTGSPTAYSVGSPVIDGSVVKQIINWPGAPNLTANVYQLNIAAVTSFNQSIPAWSRIVIDAVR